MRINILSQLLCSQIAAGEVIERPASVVKELLENSLDAGATRLEIEVLGGGVEMIRVRDNGCGIAKEDLSLAIQRYATSKIRRFEDLEHLHTLGFRGEALASISSVSRFTLTSRCRGEKVGWQIKSDPQDPKCDPLPSSHPDGTSIEVRDLFFNTPVRRKFLRTEKTEFRQLLEVVNRIALSRFDVEFLLKYNESTVFNFKIIAQELSDDSNLIKRERIGEICGKEFVDNALLLDSERNGLKITGWIAKPVFSRNQADLQYFYVNGRIVRDKLLNHAVRKAYQDVIPHGRQPCFVLYLELNPELVDVNVHPTKYEVRFRDSSAIHSFVVCSLKEVLASTLHKNNAEQTIFNERKDFYIDWQKEIIGDLARQASFEKDEQCNVLVSCIDKPKLCKGDLSKHDCENFQCKKQDLIPSLSSFFDQEKNSFNMQSAKQMDMPFVAEEFYPLGYAIAEIQGTYILAQNSLGIILVDIHAAHERITYERLKKSYANSSIKIQELLFPITFSLSKKEALVVDEYKENLKELGLHIECIGLETVIVRTLPNLISGADSEQFVRDVLADLGEHGRNETYDFYIDKILTSFACHHSVRANQKLSLEEMNHLLREIEETERGGQCGHGRPTFIEISFDKIAKMFLR